MENLIISACLLGVSCRYDGKSKPLPEIEKLMGKYNLVPVCAEIMGGLPTPRVPAEIIGEKNAEKMRSNVINAPFYEISSTFLRKKLENSENVANFISEEVLNYIKENNLYRG